MGVPYVKQWMTGMQHMPRRLQPAWPSRHVCHGACPIELCASELACVACHRFPRSVAHAASETDRQLQMLPSAPDKGSCVGQVSAPPCVWPRVQKITSHSAASGRREQCGYGASAGCLLLCRAPPLQSPPAAQATPRAVDRQNPLICRRMATDSMHAWRQQQQSWRASDKCALTVVRPGSCRTVPLACQHTQVACATGHQGLCIGASRGPACAASPA